MWFEQRNLQGDVCDSCAMGNEYQAKFGRIINGAALSIAALFTASTSEVLEKKVNRLVEFFRASYNSKNSRSVIEETLRLPPPLSRTHADYRSLEAMLLPICS
jgi:hypothetical protein